MLSLGKLIEAAKICDAIAANPQGRDLAKFLTQHGRSLRGTGREKKAAELFLRVAIHFPTADEVPFCLMQAAEIIRNAHGRPAEAKRVFERAAEEGEAPGDDVLRRQAEKELLLLESRGGG